MRNGKIPNRRWRGHHNLVICVNSVVLFMKRLEKPKPPIPTKGSMTFENSCVHDVAMILESILQGAPINVTVAWDVVEVTLLKED